MLDGEKAPLFKETSLVMLLKMFIWVLATFLAGLFSYLADRVDDVPITQGVELDAAALCVFLEVVMLIVASVAMVKAIMIFALPKLVLIVLSIVLIAVTIWLVKFLKSKLG